MEEEEKRDEVFWAENRHGLLICLMQTRLEDRLGNILTQAKYDNMEELDRLLDTEVRKYYQEVDVVNAYYKQFIEAE